MKMNNRLQDRKNNFQILNPLNKKKKQIRNQIRKNCLKLRKLRNHQLQDKFPVELSCRDNNLALQNLIKENQSLTYLLRGLIDSLLKRAQTHFRGPIKLLKKKKIRTVSQIVRQVEVPNFSNLQK